MKAALELSSKKNRDGLFEIYVRIQDGNKKRRIKANVAVAKTQFKSKNHNLQWVIKHPNAKAINADLKLLMDQYNDQVFTSSIQKKILTPESLIHKVSKKADAVSLIKFFEAKISQMLEYNQRKGYVQVLNNWKAYTQKENLGDLDFRQIDAFVFSNFFGQWRGFKSAIVLGNRLLCNCFCCNLFGFCNCRLFFCGIG